MQILKKNCKSSKTKCRVLRNQFSYKKLFFLECELITIFFFDFYIHFSLLAVAIHFFKTKPWRNNYNNQMSTKLYISLISALHTQATRQHLIFLIIIINNISVACLL